MDYKSLNKEQLNELVELLFTKFKSIDEMSNWISVFLDLDIPNDTIDNVSNASPLQCIWQVYENFYHNKGGEESPAGYIMVSARECGKTVAVSILEVILLLHFEFDQAHGAATESQSSVALSYIHDFLRKIEPLMVHAGWENLSQNKRTISFKAPSGKNPYIKVLICSSKGMNSLHTNVLFLDELDLADPIALKEAKNITGFSKGIHGLQVYLSTRKYAGGNVAAMVERADELNYKVLLWNILDMTEKCPSSRHKPDLPKITKYVAESLPLNQIDQAQYDFLAKTDQDKFIKLENVHAGCGTCNLLPICRGKLADKPDTSVGGFYKPIVSVIQKFKDNDPDTAMAQLLCWRPGNTGLVYPRFVSNIDFNPSNVISLDKAYESLTGKYVIGITEDELLSEIKKQEINIDAGCDFGFTNHSALIMAAFPADECWVLDCYSSHGLEFSELLEIAIKYRDRYEPSKWFADTGRPEFMATFNRNGMRTPAFKKEVIGGISALRAKIVDGTGKRRFKIIATESNKKLISAITKHSFILDAMGNISDKPDDIPQIADLCDALRYIAQNKFPVKGAGRLHHATSEPKNTAEQIAQTTNNSFLKAVQDATGVSISESKATVTKKKGGFYFSW